jgi:hypothetical protein
VNYESSNEVDHPIRDVHHSEIGLSFCLDQFSKLGPSISLMLAFEASCIALSVNLEFTKFG